MNKGRKESRQFNIFVEGINCERLYFEHLAKLINYIRCVDLFQ